MTASDNTASASDARGISTNNVRPDILTASGHYFNFFDPGNSHICISDIAHALSNICRFAGHTREFYSVAQHSVMVSRLVPHRVRLAGLLHDAAEAYLGDVTKPLKLQLPEYQTIERLVESAIFSRFGLPERMPDEVKSADLIMLATEQRDLMPMHEDTWEIIHGITPLPRSIVPLPPKDSAELFLREYEIISQESKPEQHC